MNWGDATGLVGLVVAAFAAVVSVKTRSDGKRSANAAVASAEEARRSSDAAEASLALQRDEADERRLAARPKVGLTVKKGSKNGYVLRNEGGQEAEDVTVVEGQAFRIVRRPEGVTLRTGESVQFAMLGTDQSGPAPAHVLTTWRGQDEPVAIPVQE